MYYVDPHFSNSTSGARFFSSIQSELRKFPNYSEKNYSYVLINISSPLKRFFIYKLINKKLLLRVDGNYSYPITKEAIKKSQYKIYRIIKFLSRIRIIKKLFINLSKKNFINFLFNLQFNYSNYLKIFLSNHVVYQSKFSKESHESIFPNKKSTIINNSTPWKFNNLPLIKYKKAKREQSNSILICTSFHKDRPLKGFGDLLIQCEIIKNELKTLDLKLLIFGYIERSHVRTYSKIVLDIDKYLGKNRDWISTYPSFSNYSKELSNKLLASDAYITYAQQDPCPNIVLEVLSHGLPIIGCNSGGVPEIIRNCGEILNVNPHSKSKYLNLNYEYGLKPPDIKELQKSIIRIKSNADFYKQNIQKALRENLSHEKTVLSYYELLKNLSIID